LAAAPVIALGLVVAGLAAGLVYLEEKTGLVSAAFAIVKEAARDAWKIVGPLLSEALVTLKEGWADLQPVIEDVGDLLKQHVVPVLQDVGTFLKEHPVILAAVAGGFVLMVAPILGVVAALVVILAKWDEIKRMFTETIPEAIQSVIDEVGRIPVIGDIFRSTLETIQILLETWAKIILEVFDLALSSITNAIAFWKAVFEGDWGRAWEAVKTQFSDIINTFDDVFGIALDALKDIVTSKLEMLKGIGSDIGNAIWEGVKGAFGAGTDFATSLGNAVINALNEAIPDSIDLPWPLGSVNIPDNPIPPLGGGGGGGGRLGSGAGFEAAGIRKMARGGVVTQPTLAVIGDAGPEAVVPLTGRGGDASGFARTVGEEIRRALEGVVVVLDGEPVGRLVSAQIGASAYMRART